MNLLAIDYGSKRIGLAYSIGNIIFTLPMIKNDTNLFTNIEKISTTHSINKIYIGLSEGAFALETKAFVDKLKAMLKLSIETVEESVSTIEAEAIFKKDKKRFKNYKKQIDSIAAAVILNRVLS